MLTCLGLIILSPGGWTSLPLKTNYESRARDTPTWVKRYGARGIPIIRTLLDAGI